MKYILTFIVLISGSEVKTEMVLFDRDKAIQLHDQYNFNHPNQCLIDSVLVIEQLKDLTND